MRSAVLEGAKHWQTSCQWRPALHASPVYALFGEEGLAGADFPKATADSLIGGRIGYSHRPGEHDVTADNWKAYMDFADREMQER